MILGWFNTSPVPIHNSHWEPRGGAHETEHLQHNFRMIFRPHNTKKWYYKILMYLMQNVIILDYRIGSRHTGVTQDFKTCPEHLVTALSWIVDMFFLLSWQTLKIKWKLSHLNIGIFMGGSKLMDCTVYYHDQKHGTKFVLNESSHVI